MSFKSYECHYSAITLVSEFETDGAMLIVTAGTSGGAFSTECDPVLSNFIGAVPVQGAMTADEFYELWPLLAGLFIVGVGVKYLRKVLGH